MNEVCIPEELYITITSYLSQPDIYCLSNTSESWKKFINTQSVLNKKISFKKISSNLLSYIADLIPTNRLCMMAFKTGNIEILKWARGRRPYWCMDGDMSYAAQKGHFEIIKWARENDYGWNSYTCSYAAKNGYLEILKWAREHGCDWSVTACEFAAKNNQIEVLKWLRKNKCPWNSRTITKAASRGNLEIIKWARKEGCDWNQNACINAALRGHIEVLKWLKKKGCVWNTNFYSESEAKNDYLDIIQLVYNGRKLSHEQYVHLNKLKNPEIRQWIIEMNIQNNTG